MQRFARASWIPERPTVWNCPGLSLATPVALLAAVAGSSYKIVRVLNMQSLFEQDLPYRQRQLRRQRLFVGSFGCVFRLLGRLQQRVVAAAQLALQLGPDPKCRPVGRPMLVDVMNALLM